MSPKPIIDIYDEHWEQTTREHLKALTAKHPGLRPVALLDGAFIFDRLLPWMEQWLPSESWMSLYASLPNTDRRTIQASPQLVDLSLLNDMQCAALLKGTSGYPMLSIMMTQASLSHIACQLAPFCIVGTPVGRYALRFADTRLLPSIIELLNHEQYSLFKKDVHAWHYIDRSGQWTILSLLDDDDQMAIPPINGIAFSDEQYTALMASAQIDRVIAFVEDTSPELYACWQRPSKRYDWFQKHMAFTDAPTSVAELPAYLEWHAEHQQLLKEKT